MYSGITRGPIRRGGVWRQRPFYPGPLVRLATPAISIKTHLVLESEMVRFIHHLGPRYQAKFQTRTPVRLLTYEASTSLGLYVSGLKNPAKMKEIFKSGFNISEKEIVFFLTPKEAHDNTSSEVVLNLGTHSGFVGDGEYKGDVICVNSQCVDDVLWEIGGPSIALRLVEISQASLSNSPPIALDLTPPKTSADLANSIGILLHSIQANWRNSDEMEQMSEGL